nr:hypothetical protein [Tanacetum cinerariifolium]
ESDPHQEEIDVVSITDDVLPPSIENDDSDGEVDDSDFDNPPLPLPPLKPPDKGFDFENEILVGCRLIGLKDSACWVKGTGSHGVLGVVNGTVQVDAGVRERSYGGDGKKAGNAVAG